MPRVHRFVDVTAVRSQIKELADLRLHIGVDLSCSESLFGRDWDRDAREVGRRLRAERLKVVVRGPGYDHPLGALDAYVMEGVRACHDRAITAAMHYGAETYLVRLGSTHGLPRSERMARQEATGAMIRQLASAARSRGMAFAVEPHLEHDPDTLDMLVDVLTEADGGIVLAPALALCSGVKDVRKTMERCKDRLAGLDLTDRQPQDLEPRAPGTGILADNETVSEMLQLEQLRFFCLDGPTNETSQMVEGLNSLARQTASAQAE